MNVDHEKAVAQMAEMGYSKEQSEKALNETKSIEAALEWLVNHGDDEVANTGGVVAKSIRCTETGKLFRSMADAMIYAERTGKASFEETDQEIPPLTEEEKQMRIQKAKEMIKLKLAQKEETSKREELERERARREGGRQMGAIREEQLDMQRKRDAEEREREKQRVAAQAKRLREQVALDKANRAFEKAKRLGGNPKEAYDLAYKQALHMDEKSPEEKAELSLKLIGLTTKGNPKDCVTTIGKLLANIQGNPAEEKFHRINLSNEKIQEKIVRVNGGTALLKAAGFEEQDGVLVFDSTQLDRLQKVLEKVTHWQTTH